MYHYLGTLLLHSKATLDKYSRFRCPCKIDEKYFDCQLAMVGRESLAPNESVEVQITFLSIDVVVSYIQVGKSYQLCEGPRTIGEILITEDPWSNVEEWISEDEVRQAVIDGIGWTKAGILIEGNITSSLTSEEMGLQAWEEISLALKVGELVNVRIEKIDNVNRKIEVSFIDRVLS